MGDGSDDGGQGHPLLTLDLQEGRQQLVLVLLCRDRVCQLLAIVERLQQGLEAVV